jgi:hypothetical protein
VTNDDDDGEKSIVLVSQRERKPRGSSVILLDDFKNYLPETIDTNLIILMRNSDEQSERLTKSS